ncbi:MAG: hypothetical protein NVS4B8_08030 [Herpetosiphon sp.]
MDAKQTTLTTYVGDMHALEHHMLQPFQQQLKLTKDHAEAHQVVQQLVDTATRHVTELAHRNEQLGHPTKSISDTVKTAVSAIFGLGAAAIDTVRPQQVSKALRDSYTAVNHAVIGYVMLQTTALALADQETADLAARHLQDHAHNAQAIASVMPKLVLADVRDDVGQVPDVSQQITGNQQVSFLYHASK